MDIMVKVVRALRAKFPKDGDITLAVGFDEADGDTILAVKETTNYLDGIDNRQIRSIGLRLIAVAYESKGAGAERILRDAMDALEGSSLIRVLDVEVGQSADFEKDVGDEGAYLESARLEVR